MNRVYCQTCTDAGRRGYCAPARCYCGHPECWASASWVDLSTVRINVDVAPANEKMRKSWEQRTEATWLDKL